MPSSHILGQTASSRENVTKRYAACFRRSKLTWAVTLIRVLLVLNVLLPPDLSGWLYSANVRSVLIDPVFTIHHVKEATAVRHLSDTTHSFVDAYRGHATGNSRIHLPPLLLAAVEAILHQISGSYWQHVVIAILLVLVDFWIALHMEQLAASVLQLEGEDPREEELMKKMDSKILPETANVFPLFPDSESLFSWQELPFFVAQLYYSNPITVISGSAAAMSCCFQNLRLLCLVTAASESFRDGGSVVKTAFALALATYVDWHGLVFLIPVVMMNGGAKSKNVGVLWNVFTVVLQALSILLVGSDNYFTIFTATHLHSFRLKGLAPSLTTVWYFSMEVFLRFRLYFEFLLGGLPYLIIIPLTVRLYRYPAVLVRASAGFMVDIP